MKNFVFEQGKEKKAKGVVASLCELSPQPLELSSSFAGGKG